MSNDDVTFRTGELARGLFSRARLLGDDRAEGGNLFDGVFGPRHHRCDVVLGGKREAVLAWRVRSVQEKEPSSRSALLQGGGTRDSTRPGTALSFAAPMPTTHSPNHLPRFLQEYHALAHPLR